MDCYLCGMSLGSMQVHPKSQCNKQQEINRANLGIGCKWCGNKFNHKDGCPKNGTSTLTLEKIK